MKNKRTLLKGLILSATLSLSIQAWAAYDEKSSSVLEIENQLVKGATIPILNLTKSMGSIGLEAVSMGLTTLSDASYLNENLAMIVYVDIDDLTENNKNTIVEQLYKALDNGLSIVLESGDFNKTSLHEFYNDYFADITYSGHKDVGIVIKNTFDDINAYSIDPNELALMGGVAFENTTEYLLGHIENNNVSIENDDVATTGSSKSSSADKRRSRDRTLRFAQKAYESRPSDGTYNLKYNGTYVDVWTKRYYPFGMCIVAWRGTVITNLYDVWADLRSQAAYRNQTIPNTYGLKGGRGFVNRVSSYYEDVMNTLINNNCKNITITGHSLGGATATVFAARYAYDGRYFSFGRQNSFVIYNSPNTLDSNSANIFRNPISSIFERDYEVFCRNHDWLVNPLPTGLHRVGPANSSPIKGCTYVGHGRWSPLPTTNHALAKWQNENF